MVSTSRGMVLPIFREGGAVAGRRGLFAGAAGEDCVVAAFLSFLTPVTFRALTACVWLSLFWSTDRNQRLSDLTFERFILFLFSLVVVGLGVRLDGGKNEGEFFLVLLACRSIFFEQGIEELELQLYGPVQVHRLALKVLERMHRTSDEFPDAVRDEALAFFQCRFLIKTGIVHQVALELMHGLQDLLTPPQKEQI